jgi:nucleoside triphosphate diphosphatase
MEGVKLLLETMKKLRDPETGCPWDLQQNHYTLLPYLHEELLEFEESLIEKGMENNETIAELGDLFFQIVFHAQLLEEKKISSLNEIAKICAQKLISRHPHVFDQNDQEKISAKDVRKNWEQQKQKKSSESQSDELPITKHVSKVPDKLDALMKAQRLGDRAASFGFDWESSEDVLEKVSEEYMEFTTETNEEAKQEELGDLVFSLSQYSRKKGWDLSLILKKANLKFLSRFAKTEAFLKDKGLEASAASLEDWNRAWNHAKLDKNPKNSS